VKIAYAEPAPHKNRTPLEKRLRAGYQTDPASGCWLWQKAKDKYGYGRLSGFTKDNKKEGSARRHAWALEHGAIPPKMSVMDVCGNPSCVNPAHMVLGTHADLAAKRKAQGNDKYPRGENAGRAKLSEDQVRVIKHLCRSGLSLQEIADQYKVSPSNIAAIKHGRSWSHIDD
jgi:hypothetical protein